MRRQMRPPIQFSPQFPDLKNVTNSWGEGVSCQAQKFNFYMIADPEFEHLLFTRVGMVLETMSD